MAKTKKGKGKGGKGCIFALAIMLASPVMADTMQCQTFSDGQIVCYPVGGGSTYGR